VPPVSTISRYSMAVLAVGDRAEPPSFYSALTDVNCPADLNTVPATSDAVVNRDTQSSEQSLMAIEHDAEHDEETEEKEAQWNALMALLEDKHQQFGNTSSGLKTMITRLRRVSTVGQWEAFMHSAGDGMPLRHHPRAAIRVQPTSVSRRMPGVSRGSKRRPCGRPPKSDPARHRVKRPRNLQCNVSHNRPNAKSHGEGH